MALAVILVMLVAGVVAAPYAATPWRVIPVFVPTYNAALVVIDVTTAFLLFGQFRELHQRSLLVLACGYLFTTVVIAAHALSFPGVLGVHGLIGGNQTAAWLWVCWHGFFPCFVAGYAILAWRERLRGTVEPSLVTPARRLSVISALAAVAFAGVCILVARSGQDLLPVLMDGNRHIPGVTRPILSMAWFATLIALGLLLWCTRARRIIDLWLIIVLCIWLIDTALSGILVTGRFQIGFYIGRIYSLFAMSLMLGVLLKQTLKLHGQLAHALQAERNNAQRATQAEAQVRASEAQLQTLFSEVPLGVYLVDADFRICQVNPTARQVFHNIPDLIGRDFGEVMHILWPPEYATEIIQKFRRTLETGKPYFEPERIEQRRDRDATEYCEWQISRIPLPNGRYGVVCYFRDISAQVFARQAIAASEEALRNSQARLRIAIDAAQLGTWDLELDTYESTVSPRMAQIIGLPPGQTRVEKHEWVSLPEERSRIEAALAAASARGAPFELEFRFVPRGGTEQRWLHSWATVVKDAAGKPLHFLGVAMDVTARKRVDEALRESEARYRSLFESIDEGFCVIEVIFDKAGKRPLDYRFLEVNPAFERHTGLVDAVGKTMRSLAPAHEPHWFDIYGRVALTGELVRFQNSAGALGDRWFDVCAFRIGNAQQRRVAVIFTDITERKNAEAVLHRDAMLLANVRDSVIVTDLDGIVTFWNDGATKLFGYEASEMLGRPYADRQPEPLRTETRLRIRRIAKGGDESEGEWLSYRKDGSPVWIHAHTRRINDAAGKPVAIMGLAHDITERKHTEEVLREREERLQLALAIETVGIIFFGLDGRITDANEAFLQMSGYGWEELAAGNVCWDMMTPAEFMPASCKAVEQLKTLGRTVPYEKQYIRKDGSRWWGLVAATLLSDDEGVEFIIDVTERRQAEEALKQADRHKDEFLATLSHELRNPLAPIMNSLSILELAGEISPKFSYLLDIMKRQSHNLVRLVDDLLELSRISRGSIELHPEQADVAAIIRSAIETSRPLIESAGHRLTVFLPSEVTMLEVDSLRLSQVVANLLNNAAKYTNPGGQIVLSVREADTHLLISVRDNGIGIPAEMLPRIFEMFVQGDRDHKPSQGGLGVGLNLVKSLVQMHGGSVEAHSAGLGRGSEFIVRLPLLRRHPQAINVDDRSVKAAPTACRVLVVDDNADAAASLGVLLQTMGNEVQVVHDGASALTAVVRHQPQVVFLDLGMPDMSGYEVAERIANSPARAAITLIALTGWGQDIDRQRTQAAGFDHHLVKPPDIAVVEELLSKSTTKNASGERMH
ncbi:MAG: PAS domain S-box protein [Gammaproteobacteria bacterium]|nr:PAS domain S-box protein [Gammaproteobacteria bacterium]